MMCMSHLICLAYNLHVMHPLHVKAEIALLGHYLVIVPVTIEFSVSTARYCTVFVWPKPIIIVSAC